MPVALTPIRFVKYYGKFSSKMVFGCYPRLDEKIALSYKFNVLQVFNEKDSSQLEYFQSGFKAEMNVYGASLNFREGCK